MAEHSLLPWTVSGTGEQLTMDDAMGESLMSAMAYYPWVPEKDEDWHFIVRCVNSHDELLAALKLAARVMETFEVGVDAEIRAAIAKAEAK